MEELTANAKAVGADGVMDVRCQIDGLSFFASGTAYKLPTEERAKHQVEANVSCEPEKTSDDLPKPCDIVVPIYNKKHKCYECPSCGSTLKKEQSVCLCSKEIVWSSID